MDICLCGQIDSGHDYYIFLGINVQYNSPESWDICHSCPKFFGVFFYKCRKLLFLFFNSILIIFNLLNKLFLLTI